MMPNLTILPALRKTPLWTLLLLVPVVTPAPAATTAWSPGEMPVGSATRAPDASQTSGRTPASGPRSRLQDGPQGTRWTQPDGPAVLYPLVQCAARLAAQTPTTTGNEGNEIPSADSRSASDPTSADQPPDAARPRVSLPSRPTAPSRGQLDRPGRAFSPQAAAALTSVRAATSQRRLARSPAMFGDFLGPSTIIDAGDFILETPVPSGGGVNSVVRMSENNLAMTGDRCFVLYNHFHNARTTTFAAGDDINEEKDHLNRVTFGLERKFGDGLWSLDFRLPLWGNTDTSLLNANDRVVGQDLGDMGLIVKRVLYESDSSVVSTGMGITFPTGDDVTVDVSLSLADLDGFVIRRRAYHLLPFIGIQKERGLFYSHGFAQLNFALNGDRIDFQGDTDPLVGYLNSQTLLYLDWAGGAWLYLNKNAPILRGVAAQMEFHYTTSLQDADIVETSGPDRAPTRVGNTINRFDVVNFTAAVHADLGRHLTFRVGGAFPLSTGDNRFFQSEVIAQLIFR